ncbi:hypothetical protein KAI92_02775 [Candidatus Parcubacteria bacterium]|nr:hypothetical protein [Candidatus Parcubacteria bacterium]
MRIKLSGTEEQVEVMEKYFIDNLGLLDLLDSLEITVNFDEYRPNYGFQNYTIVFNEQGLIKKEWISVAEVFVESPLNIILGLKEDINNAILKNPKMNVGNRFWMCCRIAATKSYRYYFFDEKRTEEFTALMHILCNPANFLIEIKQAISIKPTK